MWQLSGPHTKKYMNKLEAIQKRAARFVVCDFRRTSSIPGILQNLQWKTIKAQHKELRILMLYKIIHRFVELSLPNYIIPAPCCTRRNSTKFIQPMTSIDSYKFSFFPYSITQWNKLPDHRVSNENRVMLLFAVSVDFHTE